MRVNAVLSALVGIAVAEQHLFTPRLPTADGPLLRGQSQQPVNFSAYPAETVQIPVDHFDPSNTQTYSNRFWTNTQYYKPGGPVIYYDSGEQNAEYLIPYNLHDAGGPAALTALAKRYHGVAVIFEHRYYGGLGYPENGSYPVPINDRGRASDYSYLNTEQALQDVVYFADNFSPSGLGQYWSQLGPSKTPWIWLGGSYPGIRGTHMRVRNPEVIFATWASSAPTQSVIDMYTYYAAAERSMTRNCSADYTAVTKYVDSVLANGTAQEISDLKFDLYKAIESSPGGITPANLSRADSDGWSNSDVGGQLLTPFDFYQYYGFQASILPFCDILETFNQTANITTDNGGTAPAIAGESGVAASHNITAAWNAFLVGIAEIDYDSLPGNGLDDPVQGYSWSWQYCSEYGFYQVGNATNPHTIQSQFYDIATFQDGCNQMFANNSLPASPNIEASNKYGGFAINPSNTMFTTGQFDPWRSCSPTSIDYAIGAPGRISQQIIPQCNQAPDAKTVFGIEHAGMVHVSDLRALLNKDDPYHQNFSTVGFASPISTEPFYSGLGLFQMALDEWLPCFGNGSYAQTMAAMGLI